jgi:hypothetical protein
MSAGIRKGVALGAGGANLASIYSYQFQRGFATQTSTKWVRFWANWADLEPTQGAWNQARFADLDAQIHQAIADGLVVILTAFLCPPWASSGVRATYGVPASDPRVHQWVPDYTTLYYPGTQTLTPWANFIDRLVVRYNPANPAAGGTYIQTLEICNEPNLQMRPQDLMVARTAQMMKTAQAVKARNGLANFWPVLLAPATADSTSTSPNVTPYNTFTTNLINTLNGWQAGAWFGWSHHNHRDIELDAGVGGSMTTVNRAKAVRDAIKGKWWGWGSPSNPNDPRILLTEGGGRLDVIRNEWFTAGGTPSPDTVRNKQRTLFERNYDRMKNGADGAGVELLSYFLFTSSYDYDTGLREPYVYNDQTGVI